MEKARRRMNILGHAVPRRCGRIREVRLDGSRVRHLEPKVDCPIDPGWEVGMQFPLKICTCNVVAFPCKMHKNNRIPALEVPKVSPYRFFRF